MGTTNKMPTIGQVVAPGGKPQQLSFFPLSIPGTACPIVNKKRVAWNKGKTGLYHHSENSKRKLSEANSGCRNPMFGKQAFLGRKHTEETKRKISLSHIGKIRSEETCKKLSEYHTGKYPSEETRRKMSESHKGDRCHLWRGGITKTNKIIRTNIEYRLWRESVFSGDKWICQSCGQRGGKLQAHHIKSFSQYPELRFVVGNGITLCRQCHKKTDNYASKSTKSKKGEMG